MKNNIKMLLVFRNEIYRNCLKDVLKSIMPDKFWIDCETGKDAQKILKNELIDIMLIEINSKNQFNFNFIPNIIKTNPQTKIVVLTDLQLISKVYELNVDAFIRDFSDLNSIYSTIEKLQKECKEVLLF